MRLFDISLSVKNRCQWTWTFRKQQEQKNSKWNKDRENQGTVLWYIRGKEEICCHEGKGKPLGHTAETNLYERASLWRRGGDPTWALGAWVVNAVSMQKDDLAPCIWA